MMPIRVLGPVFTFERIIAARRWQGYALRSLFVAALLVGMTLIWWGQVAGKSGVVSIRAQAEIGQWYFYALIGTQLALVLLAAPAFTAGSICLDRSRGMLAHMLMTDLSDSEIVLGKLAARLLPVFGLIACALPVLSLSTLLGGMDPLALGLAFLITTCLALLGCTLALTLSVWAKKTHDVLMATYAVWVVLLLFQPIWELVAMSGPGVAGPPSWVLHLNPFWLAFA
ncbi:MAG: ABC transporter permease, partial [Isosphaeraceae bacterium]